MNANSIGYFHVSPDSSNSFSDLIIYLPILPQNARIISWGSHFNCGEIDSKNCLVFMNCCMKCSALAVFSR